MERRKKNNKQHKHINEISLIFVSKCVYFTAYIFIIFVYFYFLHISSTKIEAL